MSLEKKPRIHNLPQLEVYRKALRQRQTLAEARLWEALRGRKLGVRVRRQHSIGPYVVDFYCARAKVIIEVDGGYHLDPVVAERDAIRTEWLEQHGFTLIRFWNEEVLENLDEVISKLKNRLC